jgi:hypothetical protein
MPALGPGCRSLLHATALHTLRGDTTLDSLQSRDALELPDAGATALGASGCCSRWDVYGASAAGPIAHLGEIQDDERQLLQVPDLGSNHSMGSK